MFKQINERENSSWTMFPTKLLLNTLSLTYFDYKSLISDIGKKIIVFNIFAWFHISLTFCKSNFLPLRNKIIFLFRNSISVCMHKNITKVFEDQRLVRNSINYLMKYNQETNYITTNILRCYHYNNFSKYVNIHFRIKWLSTKK